MSKRESRSFSREFKLEAVRRIEAGENARPCRKGDDEPLRGAR